MALDGKVLAKAKTILEEKKRQRDELFGYRLQKVYSAAPCVRETDAQLRATMAELVGVAVGASAASQIEEIRERNLKLQEKRRNEITKAGFDPAYLDDEYMCIKCHDTGYAETKMCKCLEKIYRDEQKSSLSNLFKLGNETFDNFDISYYDDTAESGTNITPRRNMERIYEICVEYAKKFNSRSMNLFFNGAPGLGKTFLSACIARVVADNGHSVVYETATSLFAKFEDAKFLRTDDLENTRNETKRYLECDLLIIDDLGTEMTTAFTTSTLYEVINTRLITGCKTIINSNLTIDEMRRRYSEQIMSRLEGEYQVLTFYGSDIRLKKNIL